MTARLITDDRIHDLIDAYGAEPGAWPEDEAAAASARIAEAPDVFADSLAAARLLDLSLNSLLDAEPGANLSSRILATAPTAISTRRSLFTWLGDIVMPQGARWPAGAVLASLLVGISAGPAVADLTSGPVESEADEVVYAALGFADTDTWVEETDQ